MPPRCSLRSRSALRGVRRTFILRECLTYHLYDLENQTKGTPLIRELIERATNVQLADIAMEQECTGGAGMSNQFWGGRKGREDSRQLEPHETQSILERREDSSPAFHPLQCRGMRKQLAFHKVPEELEAIFNI